jgi:D-alanyl-D-alanine carboxypeptidase
LRDPRKHVQNKRVLRSVAWLLSFLPVLLLASEASARRYVPALTRDGRPNLMSESALIAELQSGNELYSKRADDVRSIASISKLMAAMVVLEKGIDLDGTTVLSEIDRIASRGGARSRLEIGHAVRNVDLLRAALMVFLRAALRNPMIAEIARTWTYEVVTRGRRPKRVLLTNTDKLIRGRWKVLGGKTGYNGTAGYCLAVAMRLPPEIAGSGDAGEREVAMIFLGARGKHTRFAEVNRVLAWLERGVRPASALPTVAVPSRPLAPAPAAPHAEP